MINIYGSYCVNLCIMNVSHNKLLNIPSDMAKCVNLKTLHAYHNYIQYVPSKISNICLINLGYANI